jgi:hypothetical protein
MLLLLQIIEVLPEWHLFSETLLTESNREVTPTWALNVSTSYLMSYSTLDALLLPSDLSGQEQHGRSQFGVELLGDDALMVRPW